MAKLNENEKLFVIQQLATFSSPSEVAELVRANFGKEVTRQQVFFYDAGTNSQTPKKWREVFKNTRNEYLSDASRVAIANKVFRLRKLNDMFSSYERRPEQNTLEMRAILEQAAKETGGAYTNRRKIDQRGEMQVKSVVIRPKQ